MSTELQTDRYQGKIPPLISQDELRPLLQLQPWRSYLAVATEWGIVIGAVALCERFFSPLLYAATVILLGSR